MNESNIAIDSRLKEANLSKLKVELENVNVEFYFDYSLKNFNTWQIDEKAEVLVILNENCSLETILKIAVKFKLKYTILGKGSNVLVPAGGIGGMVIVNKSRDISLVDIDTRFIKYNENDNIGNCIKIKETNLHLFLNNTTGFFEESLHVPRNINSVESRHKEHDLLNFKDIDNDLVNLKTCDYRIVKFNSGVDLAYAINWTHKNNLTGLQFFAGIPSTFGGALFNNIHGGSRHFSDKFLMAEVLEKVESLPKIVVIVGLSGVGKSKLISQLLFDYADKFEYFSTTTTRIKRKDDSNLPDRVLITKQEFQDKINNGDFLEHETIFGNYYGIEKKSLETALQSEKIIILDTDVRGAISLKKYFKQDLTSIFVKPKNISDLELWLTKRQDYSTTIAGDEELTGSKLRLERAKIEIGYEYLFDYSIFAEEIGEKVLPAYNSLKEVINSLLDGARFVRSFFNVNDMNLGYDQSLLRENRKISILNVFMLLPVCEDDKLIKISKENANNWLLRKKIQPRNSCGSVFQSLSKEVAIEHNLPVQAVGYIIDNILHWKGKELGGAQIYDKHANFIINKAGATSDEIQNLVAEIKREVKARLGIEIHEEFDYLPSNK